MSNVEIVLRFISGAFRGGWALFPYFRISFSPCEMTPEQLHQVSVLFLGLAVNICVALDLEFQGLDSII